MTVRGGNSPSLTVLAFVLAAGAFFLVLADLHSHRTAQVNS
jgi:hypothetical protein